MHFPNFIHQVIRLCFQVERSVLVLLSMFLLLLLQYLASVVFIVGLLLLRFVLDGWIKFVFHWTA